MLRYLCLFVFGPVLLFAQVTGFLENFNDHDLAGWESPHSHTFALAVVDSALEITYTRDAESDALDGFNFIPPRSTATNKPYISVRVKSNISTDTHL
ncbi:MAG: hypothetical protein U5R06_03375 [candidate division KSB1 bacterium]|nr:hypothetical protein [candidate division KSB1 bacterium]